MTKAQSKITWRRRLMVVVLALAVGGLLIGALLPIHRYRAYCPGDPSYIDGPYRDRFIWLISWALKNDGYAHVIYRGEIYVNWFLGGRPGPGAFVDTHHFQINTDWKLASSIGDGVDIDDAHFAPPARLRNLLKKSETRYGPFPMRTAEGERIYGPDIRFHDDCELFKAAILPDEAFGAPP